MTQALAPAREEGPSLLHEFFESAADQWPQRVAVETPPGPGRPERRTATYAAVKRRSDALASTLRALVTEECIVAILLKRDSEDLFAAQLAVLKAGAAHLCIEPNFPDEQIREILADSGAVAVLSDTAGLLRLSSLGLPGVECIDIADHAGQADVRPAAPWLTPDSLAYIIYTSGTTGRPKGVMITHRSIANLVRSDIAEFALGPGDRVAQGSSAAYDSSVEETWLALASGATLIVMGDETARLGPDLVPWLRQERITALCPPPTLLRTTGCDDPKTALPDLRLLYVGGEPLTSDVADVWGEGRRLVNGYGPTECTVTCTRCDVVPGEEITIGLPVPGMHAWILNEKLDEVPAGEAGELCLSGLGLARGYHRSPDLTHSRFIEHPRLGRIYRTGDLARRGANGNISCQGRLDAQIKLRGYRIELEAIEVTMAQVEGVREAACRVQSRQGREDLVAFVVPAEADRPPTFEAIKEALGRALPSYMTPVRFGYLTELPRTVGGKLNRARLPDLELLPDVSGRFMVAPRTAIEAKVHAAFQGVLGVKEEISVEDDFFTDLGGSSLLAARLVSLMRGDPELASVAVRDIYEARTIGQLAQRVGPSVETTSDHPPESRAVSHVGATALQSAWLLLELVVGSAAAGAVALWLSPLALSKPGQVSFFTGCLLFGLLVLFLPLLTVGGAVAMKRALIGRYTPCREPVWGGFFVRNWIVQQMVRLIPWRLLEGTELACVVLRALGARIGQGVHFHRGTVPLTGGWDLLDIGDEVTVSQDAALRLVTLEAGQIVVGPIKLAEGATLGVRAGMAPHASLGAGSYLTALSSLASYAATGSGELWDGIPAKMSGAAPKPPSISDQRQLGPLSYAVALMSARRALLVLVSLPALVSFSLLVLWLQGNDSDSVGGVIAASGVTAALCVAAVLPTLALQALVMRLMGRVPEGVISVRSWAYIRVTLKSSLLESAGRGLSGTLFWPTWLRWAGMRIGKDCEISTIIDVVPELVEIEGDCFLADGIYLGSPDIQRGVVRLSRLRLSRNTFIGNHAVIPAGQSLPADILLGVCTVADQRLIRSGTSWFGLPPFELPRREIIEHDRSLTHDPSRIRYWNRVFWEALRIVTPVGPACSAAVWMLTVSALATRMSPPLLLFVGAPLVTVAIAFTLCASAVLLKWALLGKVRPGVHALWSCWCSRWDFHYVVWSEWARPILVSLEGTLLLNACLRSIGTKIGRRVVLGSGFSQVVDPDMIKIGDGATVNAMFQAHTFEDRVLKIDEITVEPYASLSSATVLLYGAEIGKRALVTAHGVVMKHERLLPGLQYEGAPTRQVRGEIPK